MNEPFHLLDELARAIFDVLERADRHKRPATIAVAQGLSGGPRRVVRKTRLAWQDYRPEARSILEQLHR